MIFPFLSAANQTRGYLHQRSWQTDTAQGTKARITARVAITGGNRFQASKLLGMYRPTLHAKIEKYDLKIETSVR